ncbi:hypothetical protein GE061_004287 [Apolygus lucorum]|uniref:Uncharacterized protein n=1 Tax=Apolygus lucorum TaxID=248454 RepID=A0A8S9X0N4_APOLU|nr:hypothetical protein GE061_004287 [Apolygus lucorum]
MESLKNFVFIIYKLYSGRINIIQQASRQEDGVNPSQDVFKVIVEDEVWTYLWCDLTKYYSQPFTSEKVICYGQPPSTYSLVERAFRLPLPGCETNLAFNIIGTLPWVNTKSSDLLTSPIV